MLNYICHITHRLQNCRSNYLGRIEGHTKDYFKTNISILQNSLSDLFQLLFIKKIRKSERIQHQDQNQFSNHKTV